MASEEIFPGQFDDDDDRDDDALDDDDEFREFFGMALNMAKSNADAADDKFLGVVLPELRADGDDDSARALVADYVRKHGKPMEF